MIRLYELELETSCQYGKDVEQDRQILLRECKNHIKNYDANLINKAFDSCVNDFKGITRSSGDPYYTHPLKVALSLMNEFNYGDNISIAACLLHDTLEDIKSAKISNIQSEFGYDVANIVDGLTKIKGSQTRTLDKASTYRKLFQALVQDIRVILIKLADRLDNMRTLYHLSEKKQKLIGHETLNFYTPFAQRLGLIKIKRALEDLSLYFTDRKAYEEIHPALELKRRDFLEYITNFYDNITNKLTEREINHVITIEHKHVYEIFKMIENGKSLKDIDNFYSIVITLNTNDYAECYRTYGVIANVFGPVSSLDDYIARPKINFYRALHSTHFGPGRKLVEVIIRTEEMDKIAEGGIAALFKIKEDHRSLTFNEKGSDEWLEWMQNIVNEGDEDAIQKIWGSIRMNLYEDQITVHSTGGQTYLLPKGSCPIDLAFAISEDTGLHCITAKINGEIKNLNYELKSNDYVEIITSPKSKPLSEWQDHIVSHLAVVKLHNYFRNLQSELPENLEKDKSFEVKFRVIGEDRPGMLNEITKALSDFNILRVNLYSANSIFEGAFTLQMEDSSYLNKLFTKLLSIKGLKGVERVDEVY